MSTLLALPVSLPSELPQHLVAASTNPQDAVHPLLDALVPLGRRHVLAWRLQTGLDTLRHGLQRWRHPWRDIEQRGQLEFTRRRETLHRFPRGELLLREPPLVSRLDLLLWKLGELLPGRGPSPGEDTQPPAHDLRRWWPLRGIAQQLAARVHDRPPVCGPADLESLREAPSWVEARRLAAARWPDPAVARAALVWAARADQPVWAWRQLFHRERLTERAPLLPFPRTVEVTRDPRHEPFGPGDRFWRRWYGQQPVLEELPSVRDVRVSSHALAQWMGQNEHDPQTGRRLRRWYDEEALGEDPAQESRSLAWYRLDLGYGTAPINAPTVNALCRWVQLDGASLADLARREGPVAAHADEATVLGTGRQGAGMGHGTLREPAHRAGFSEGLLTAQIFQRSLLALFTELRAAASTTPLRERLVTDLRGLLTIETTTAAQATLERGPAREGATPGDHRPAAAMAEEPSTEAGGRDDRPTLDPALGDATTIRQWTWWSDEEPTGGRLPALGRIAGWYARLGGSKPELVWQRLATMQPVLALKILQHRTQLIPSWSAPSPTMLRALLLAPDPEVRQQAIAALGVLGRDQGRAAQPRVAPGRDLRTTDRRSHGPDDEPSGRSPEGGGRRGR